MSIKSFTKFKKKIKLGKNYSPYGIFKFAGKCDTCQSSYSRINIANKIIDNYSQLLQYIVNENFGKQNIFLNLKT
jgi:hypothetical protein